ncbi:MAG: hypothetical protein JW953_22160 [Anaerolineae bacterium]|nr:hypothetical protein [Anaerolineae bacterium]
MSFTAAKDAQKSITAEPLLPARSSLPALAKLILIGLSMQFIYVVYIVAFPLISNTQKGGPAADLEILMHDYRWFAPIYLVGLLLLYYLFWQAMRIVSSIKGQGSRASQPVIETTPYPSRFPAQAEAMLKLLILAFGLLFGFTLVWLYPITANDLFRYVLRARLWAIHGASPMLVPPNTFPNDPYLPFAGEFGHWVSGYGALWEIMAQIPLRLFDATGMVSGSISLKLVVWLCYLACAVLLGWYAAPQKGSSLTALTFFAWNPLILMQGPGNGHNDMLFMAFMVLGLVFWQRRVWWAAVLALTLAAIAKIPALLMVPLFAVVLLRHESTWQQRLLKGAGAALIGLVTVYLIYAVMGPLPQIFQDVWNALTRWLDFVLSASETLTAAWLWLTTQLGFMPLSADTPPGLGAMLTTRRGFAVASGLRMVLREVIPWDVAETLPRTTAQYIFILFYLWLLVELWRKKLDLVTAGFLAYFSQLILGSTFRIWYPMWLIPLAALHLTPATFWRAVLFSLTAELSIINYFVVWRWWLRDLPWDKLNLANVSPYWPVMHTLTVPWVFGIPLFGPIIIARWQRQKQSQETQI